MQPQLVDLFMVVVQPVYECTTNINKISDCTFVGRYQVIVYEFDCLQCCLCWDESFHTMRPLYKLDMVLEWTSYTAINCMTLMISITALVKVDPSMLSIISVKMQVFVYVDVSFCCHSYLVYVLAYHFYTLTVHFQLRYLLSVSKPLIQTYQHLPNCVQ